MNINFYGVVDYKSTVMCSELLLQLTPCHYIPVSPSIRGSEKVSPLTVIEGSPIALVCESSGIPPPSLTWRKDGKCHPREKLCADLKQTSWKMRVAANL